MRFPFLIVLMLASCARPAVEGSGTPSLTLASTALADGAPRLALQVSEAVLAQHPRDVPALVRRGDAYYQLGQPARARESYDEALALRPRTVGALLGLGRITLATDPSDARDRFTQVLEVDPANRAARADRGVALDLLGRHSEAQADYRVVISGPGDATATRVNLGLSLAMSGDTDQAIRILEPIASAPDATARVRQDFAVALVLAGRTREAARVLLTQMSPAEAQAAIAAYGALRDRPLTPALLNGAS